MKKVEDREKSRDFEEILKLWGLDSHGEKRQLEKNVCVLGRRRINERQESKGRREKVETFLSVTFCKTCFFR